MKHPLYDNCEIFQIRITLMGFSFFFKRNVFSTFLRRWNFQMWTQRTYDSLDEIIGNPRSSTCPWIVISSHASLIYDLFCAVKAGIFRCYLGVLCVYRHGRGSSFLALMLQWLATIMLWVSKTIVKKSRLEILAKYI